MTEAEKAAAEKAAADKAAADKAEADKAEADKAAAEKAEAEKNKAGAGAGADDPKVKALEDEKAALLKEVMAFKDRARTAEEKAKAYDGIDPEAARKALAAQVEAERKALEDKGEYKRIIDQVNEANAKAVADKDKAIGEKDAEINALKTQINRLSIGNSFGSSKFISEELVLTPSKAEVLYGTHFEVEDGKVLAYDKPRGHAERTPLVDGKGAPLGFDDAIKKIVSADPDFERIKRSTMKPGAGSESNGKGANGDGSKGVSGLGRIAEALNQTKK